MPAQSVWLVTGCSTGFGEEFIKQILARGDKAISTARNPNSVQKLADLFGGCHPAIRSHRALQRAGAEDPTGPSISTAEST
ncbi:hypothetical protein LTR65_000206 [Meristemomyces frigidus]